MKIYTCMTVEMSSEKCYGDDTVYVHQANTLFHYAPESLPNSIRVYRSPLISCQADGIHPKGYPRYHGGGRKMPQGRMQWRSFDRDFGF